MGAPLLTAEEVTEIRQLWVEGYRLWDIARAYGRGPFNDKFPPKGPHWSRNERRGNRAVQMVYFAAIGKTYRDVPLVVGPLSRRLEKNGAGVALGTAPIALEAR